MRLTSRNSELCVSAGQLKCRFYCRRRRTGPQIRQVASDVSWVSPSDGLIYCSARTRPQHQLPVTEGQFYSISFTEPGSRKAMALENGSNVQ